MGSDILKLGDADFTSTIEASPVPVMVDFWAPWCQPCKLIEPFVDELAGDFAGKLTVAKVNIDESQGVAAQYNVRTIPTLLFFKNGQVVDSLQSAVPKDRLRKKIEEVLAS
jgi:thioredoxin 1